MFLLVIVVIVVYYILLLLLFVLCLLLSLLLLLIVVNCVLIVFYCCLFVYCFGYAFVLFCRGAKNIEKQLSKRLFRATEHRLHDVLTGFMFFVFIVLYFVYLFFMI